MNEVVDLLFGQQRRELNPGLLHQLPDDLIGVLRLGLFGRTFGQALSHLDSQVELIHIVAQAAC